MNKKKVAIAIAILILIIALIIFCIFYFSKKDDKNNTTLTSTDGKFSIELPSDINYKINTKKDNNYTIDLYSEEDEMFIYATSIEKSREVDLYEIANGDKTSYLKDKENVRDDSRYQ